VAKRGEKLFSGEFARREVQRGLRKTAEVLGDFAGGSGIVGTAPEGFQSLASKRCRWNGLGREASQNHTNQRHQNYDGDDAADDGRPAVRFPEGGWNLSERREEFWDFVGVQRQGGRGNGGK
jgi:hypothetical protein